MSMHANENQMTLLIGIEVSKTSVTCARAIDIKYDLKCQPHQTCQPQDGNQLYARRAYNSFAWSKC